MKLYRVMKIDPADGKPLVGSRRNMLGVRPTDPTARDPRRNPDVDAVTGSDPVHPGAVQGLSVSTQPDRLNPAPGEAVWVIEASQLAGDLRPVEDNPPHHVLEPTRVLSLDEYQGALRASREFWQKHREG